MSASSSIGWTDATWPIVAGCEYESPGCSNCWAVRDSWRISHNPNQKLRDAFQGVVRKTESGQLVWTGVVRPLEERLKWPLQWKRPRKIFVCSQADLFHPKVPYEFIDKVFAVMALAPRHIFQVLTKHPARALDYMTIRSRAIAFWEAGARSIGYTLRFEVPGQGLVGLCPFPLRNVWFGVTVEDQKRADERIPVLMDIPAAVRWISAEPLLERISLRNLAGRFSRMPEGHDHFDALAWGRIHWVVCGGESAQTRATTRPFHCDWARDLLRECKQADVAFFMKQLGTNAKTTVALDGTVPFSPPAGKNARYKFHEPAHWPEDLRVQEFPT